MAVNTVSTYSVGEEIASAVSHGLGMMAATVALTLLMVKGIPVLSAWQLAGVAVYGGSLIALLLCSTLYHSITHLPTKALFKRLDHCTIYLLIAGTYTPLMMITLNTPASNLLLGVLWAIAMIGVIFKAFFVHSYKRLSLITYLLMGWMSLFVVYELWLALPRAGFVLLLVGGGLYTVGTLFYAAKQYRYTHAIWHLFVVGGAACHCVMIGVYVIPPV